jgi:TolB-like protein
MLAGQPPFTGPTVESVVHQHLASEPRSVTELRSSVPSNVDQVVRRSLAKAPADRHATAVEFAESLARADVTSAAPQPVISRGPSRKWLVLAVVVAVIAIAAASMLRRPGSVSNNDRPTLAVLPFENLGAPEDEYFADGLTEEMTSRLAEVSGLGVVSRTSAMRYKDPDKSLREIAQELGVAYVLEGTVRTDRRPDGTGQVRVTPQLIRAEDDFHLWTDRYTADLTPGEIFSVQATIAEQVAAALDVTLLGSERAAIEAVPTDNPDAYDAYLLGRFYWNRRSAENLLRATDYFQRAVALDPEYANAHVGLADTYSLYGYYVVRDLSPANAYAQAEESARRAIAIDSSMAGAWASLANILTYGAWEWEAADSAFRRAIALDPEYPVARYWFAEHLLIVGRIDEAIAQAQRAVELDPASPVAHHILGTAVLYDGRFDEAVVHEQASVDLVPDFFFGRGGLSWALAFAGRIEESADQLERLGWPAELVAGLDEFMTRSAPDSGLTNLVNRHELQAREQRLPYAGPWFFAMLYAWLETNDIAFARLQEAYAERSEAMLFNMRHPLFDPIRSDPRYVELMGRMGLRP